MTSYPAAIAAMLTFGLGYCATFVPGWVGVGMLILAWCCVHLLAVWVSYTAPGWDTFEGIEGDD